MLIVFALTSLTHAVEPEPSERAENGASPSNPSSTEVDRSTRVGVTVGRAITGAVVDDNAFADAELHGSNFLTLGGVFGCKMGCIGFALPIEGVRATSTEITTEGVSETELQTTTLTPSVRLAYTYAPATPMGFGATGYFDVGYQFSVGGNVEVRGFALGIAGDVEYWLPPGVAISLGVGLSGSPFSVLHYPALRAGVAYAF